MRLTLRTLLAYLDDTLEPLEIKTIGQKVSESDTAQELIARIKQVTRRRRITTPPATGPNSFDPNMVAEYLDNELSAEQLAELEKICLESDVHLAEVAACHQILTLVLGEPAHVPPTAKERMYALVRGREAIPFRKAASADGSTNAPAGADADADEMFLLGLPLYRRGSWLRWALPLAAVILFAVVGVALWQSIHPVQPPQSKPQPLVASADKPKGDQTQNPNGQGSTEPNKTPSNDNKIPPVNPNGKPDNSSEKAPAGDPARNIGSNPIKPENGGTTIETRPPDKNLPDKRADDGAERRPEASVVDRDAPPSSERVKVAQYHADAGGTPSLLVQRRAREDWERVKLAGDIHTNDDLVSLPGYASEIRLDNGMHLLLRSHVREFTPYLPMVQEGQERNKAWLMDYLQECAIVLHKPKDTDVDLTLQRGRLYLSNHNTRKPGALVARLRFEKQVWDLTLQPDSEVVIELIQLRPVGEPMAFVDLLLLRGKGGLAFGQYNYPELSVSGLSYVQGNPKAAPSFRNLIPAKITPAQRTEFAEVIFAKRPKLNLVRREEQPIAEGMERALETIRKLMKVDDKPLTAIQSVLQRLGLEQPYEHRLAIMCLGAMDEIRSLLDILGRSDRPNAPDRTFAIIALRRWLDRGAKEEAQLFDAKAGKGVLIDMGYTREEAERIMELLLSKPTFEQLLTSKEYYEELARDLACDKVAIAELARWCLSKPALHMFRLKLPRLEKFNAAAPHMDRVLAMQEVMEKINEGALPPKGKADSERPGPKGGIGNPPRPKPNGK